MKAGAKLPFFCYDTDMTRERKKSAVENVRMPVTTAQDAIGFAMNAHQVGDERRFDVDAQAQKIVREQFRALPLTQQVELTAQLRDNALLHHWLPLVNELLATIAHTEAVLEPEQWVTFFSAASPVEQLSILATMNDILHYSPSSSIEAGVHAVINHATANTSLPLVHSFAQSIAPDQEQKTQRTHTAALAPHVIAKRDAAGRLVDVEDSRQTPHNVRSARVLLNDATVLPFHQQYDPYESAIIFDHLHSPEVQEYIEQRIGVPLAQIELIAQVPLLHFLLQANAETWTQIERIAKSGTVDMEQLWNAIAVVSAQGEQLFGALLNGVEHMPQHETQQLLEQCVYITHQTQVIGKRIHTYFKRREHGEQMQRKGDIFSIQTLLQRAAGQVEKALQGKTHTLTAIQVDSIIQASICSVALRRGYDIAPDDLCNTSAESARAKELPQEIAEQCEAILAQRYPEGHPAAEKLHAALHPETSAQTAQAERTTVHYIDWKNGSNQRVLSFLRAERVDEHTIYLGSLNVDLTFDGAGIGSAFVDGLVQYYRQNNDITIHSRTEGLQYYQKLGFQIETQESDDGFGPLYRLRLARKH